MNNLLIGKTILITTVLGLSMIFTQAEVGADERYVADNENVKSSTQYRCMEREGTPSTVAYTSRGAIELIRWQNDYFSASSYTPDRRCQEVSTRFQQHSEANNLRYISTGKVNNYNVICISEKSGNCKPDGLLITLQPNDSPEQVLRDLFSLDARRARGGITRADGSRKIKETIDLERYLADSPTVDDVEGIDRQESSTSQGKPVIENPFDGF